MTRQNERAQIRLGSFDMRAFHRFGYFNNRLRDSFARFTRITGALPDEVHDTGWRDIIEKKVQAFGRRQVLAVFDDSSFDLRECFAADGAPSESKCIELTTTFMSDCNVPLVIHNIKYTSDEDDLRNIIESHMHMEKDFIRDIRELDKLTPLTSLFVYDVADAVSEQQKQDAETLTLSVIEDSRDINREAYTRFIVCFDYEKVKSETVLALDRAIMDSFETMYRYVDDFVGPMNRENCYMDVIEEIELSKVIEKIIQGYSWSRMCVRQTNCTDLVGAHCVSIDKAKTELIHLLSVSISEAISQPLSLKYDVKRDICCLFLKTIKFQSKTEQALHENANFQHQLHDIIQCWVPSTECDEDFKVPKQMEQHSVTSSSVKSAIGHVIETTEKLMAGFENIVTILRRLKYELEGYFSQSLTRKELKHSSPELDKGFTDDIRKLDDVTGLGTIFGSLEIHVTARFPELLRRIEEIATTHSMSLPYKVKEVTLNKWY